MRLQRSVMVHRHAMMATDESQDKESIVAQHARGVFIKECVRDEIQIWQGTQYFISRMHQDWSSERTKYAEQQVDCWRELSEQLESMPTGGE